MTRHILFVAAAIAFAPACTLVDNDGDEGEGEGEEGEGEEGEGEEGEGEGEGSDDCTTAVEGEACITEGTSCGGPCTNPCEFCNILNCSNGEWGRIEVFPAPCTEEEALCYGTNGTWDPNSCGHYVCDDPPDCEAIIPGCDCGPGQSFTPDVGCAADPTCG